MNRSRTRVVAFAVVVVLAVSGAVAYLLIERNERQRKIAAAPTPATTSLAAIEAGPRIVFRSAALAHYGVVAMVSLRDPSGPRAYTSTPCARVYATRTRTLCVALDRVAVLYKATLLDQDRRPLRELPLAGTPSRARLSADGTLAATTAFTSVADSYAATGFSTRTYVSTLGARPRSDSLEAFTLLRDGRAIRPVDRNYWGVTFAADGNRFYATAGFGGRTYLVRGDLARRTVAILRDDAECPSLSPDERHLVYKKRGGRPAGRWRLTALDLATGRETPLAETRSVDDQVEWLDNAHVLYAVPPDRREPEVADVWTVPADGTGAPRLLIRQATSPAVVR
jgi:hypothetical protein